MAEVYKAKSHGVEGFEKILVIKRILPELSRDPRFVEMFIREAKIAVTLTHANIVQVFDLGRADNTYFIAMEHVPGFDLASVMRWAHRFEKPLVQELAVYVVSELTKGLDYAHRRRDSELQPLNIVHRDVSPQNVLLSYEGEVKLTDFGIAAARTNANALTSLPPGKFAYMAPEQARGDQVDARADLFSVGAVLYEALAGQSPLEAGTPAGTLERAKQGESVPLHEACPGVPAELSDIVGRAMAPDPEDRYASAGDLYEDLIQFLYGTGRRVGAHDLSRYLDQVAEVALESEQGDRFDPPSALEELFDDFTADHSSSNAGATPIAVPTGRSKAAAPPSVTPSAGLRPRAEWRDVSVLALRGLEADGARALAARFGGQPVRSDKPAEDEPLFLIFGIGYADGRDAQAAARCGLRLLRGEMLSNDARDFRAVVHSGRVLLAEDGEPRIDTMLETTLADTRSWLRRTAAGQVAASTAASKLLRGRFEIAPAQGDAARRVERERRADEGIGKFVGRREQLRAVGESLAFANQGRTCVVAVEGEAGAGKTRLLMETARRLEHAGHDVGFYLATCTPQMRQVPLSAVQELLRVVLGIEELEAEEGVREKVDRLRQLGLSAPQRDSVARVLGLSVENRPSLGNGTLRSALVRIALKLAEDRLSVFGWDSAELMDDASRTELQQLVNTPMDTRVVVLVAHRPTDDSTWKQAQNFRDVKVGPLSESEITKLIRARLVRSEVPQTLVREVSIKSGGNPLYIEELLKAMREAGALEVRDGEVVYRAKGIELPRSLRGLVASRVGRLEAGERSILQLAVTLGTHFTPELLARASEQDEAMVRAALGVLEERGTVRQVGPGEYTFAHALVREVLYEGLALDARPELHAAVAAAIENMRPEQHLDDVVERLAYHYRESGDRTRAVSYLVKAADRLESEHELDAAIDAMLQAIDLVLKDPSPDREQLLLMYARIGDLAYRTRDAEAVADRLEPALELAESLGRDEYVARFAMMRGRLLNKASRFQEGRQWLQRAQQVAKRRGDAALERDIALAAAEAHARNGEYVEVINFVEQALELARSTEDLGAQVRCLLIAAPAYAATGEGDVALSALRDVRELLGDTADRLTECELYKTRALVFHQVGDTEGMIESARRALDLAKEYGLHYEATVNAHNLGEFYLRLGEDKRAFAALRSSYEIAMEHGFARLQWLNVSLLGFLDAMRFDSQQGVKRMQQAIEHAEQRGYTWDMIGEKYLLAMVEQKRGHLDAARSALRDVIRLADRHGHLRVCDDAEKGLRAVEEGRPIPLLR